jgi:mono/diheme cytochrome c family protein
MEAVLTFLGRLHPVIVHLPIGILLLALLLEALSARGAKGLSGKTFEGGRSGGGSREKEETFEGGRSGGGSREKEETFEGGRSGGGSREKEETFEGGRSGGGTSGGGLREKEEDLSGGSKWAVLKPAADLALGLGVVAAVCSCCTGYLLFLSGDYDPTLVTTHLWLAVSLTLVSGALYFLIRGKPMVPLTRGLSVAVLLLIFFTGHWGGSLTHGPGYLTTDLVAGPPAPMLRPVADVQAAVLYTELVQPVLHDNCYGCHSGGHVKGGLRLDGPDAIRKGGKDGPVIVAGNAVSSLLIKRILLPLDDEQHMSPKEKPQLTKAEVKLLQWWIQTGASFEAPAGRLPQDGDVRAMLAAFHEGTAGPVNGAAIVLNVADSDMPATPVAPAPAEAIRRLERVGAVVLPIANGSNYLNISFGGDTVGAGAWAALAMVKQQLAELRCSGIPVGDSIVTIAAGCPQLVRLRLDHTAITGKNLGSLRGLSHLRYLDVASTKVRADDVLALRGMTGLRSIYLYDTGVMPGDWGGLRAAFPHTLLDSGGYRLPFLTSDTAVVRKP